VSLPNEFERDRQSACCSPFGAEESLPASFERAAELHQFRSALGSGAWRPTYRELNETANCLAHELLDRGGAPADRVAILMQHDSPAIAALLAVLKAGRIVVALNPTNPPARLKQVIRDAESSLIVTDAANQDVAANVAGSRNSPAGCLRARFLRVRPVLNANHSILYF
jgi:acyl-CoA synthetase (AMP-forming)/AMP-acid ligase II